ncbi:GtrA family protein [Paenibacillus puldeungensis]
MNSSVYKWVIQFLKFGIVGVFNTLISYIIYFLLVFAGVHYLLAHVIGFIAGVINAFYWNKKYVFEKNEAGITKTFIKVFSSYGVTFLLSTVLLFILVQYIHMPTTIAPILILFITVPLNFLLNKYWAFRSSRKESSYE